MLFLGNYSERENTSTNTEAFDATKNNNSRSRCCGCGSLRTLSTRAIFNHVSCYLNYDDFPIIGRPKPWPWHWRIIQNFNILLFLSLVQTENTLCGYIVQLIRVVYVDLKNYSSNVYETVKADKRVSYMYKGPERRPTRLQRREKSHMWRKMW